MPQVRDCSKFYKDGKLLPWPDLPIWYIQFLWSSPPDKETQEAAMEEWVRRGFKKPEGKYGRF
jgi:protoporphyrinogen oxidase